MGASKLQLTGHVLHSSLMLALFVTGALLGCRGNDLSQAQHQRRTQQDAAAELAAIGGKAVEVKRPQGMSWSINLAGAELSDRVFANLEKLGRITELNLSKASLTDADMERINSPQIGMALVKLDLSKTAVSDAGLEKLDNLMILMDLNVVGSKVTQAGIDRFKKHREADSRIWKIFKSPKIRLR
jgi:uncharacterized protein YjbI with pentapeptide repeats